MKPYRSLYAIRQPPVCSRETGKEREGWVYVPELINLPPFRVQSRHPPSGPLWKQQACQPFCPRLSLSKFHYPLSPFSPTIPFHPTLLFLPLFLSRPLHLYRHPFSTAVTRAVSSSSWLKPPPASGQNFPLMEVR